MIHRPEISTSRSFVELEKPQQNISLKEQQLYLSHIVPLSLILFAFWIVLSGKFDAFHLSIGAASAVCVARGTHRLLLLTPAIGPQSVHPIVAIPWYPLLTYVPWLIWQIVVSSFQVAYLVVHPKMPITPSVVSSHIPLPHMMARLTLATSVTLTPGTVTLDISGDDFVIHTLTRQDARTLEPPYDSTTMQHRVAKMYPLSANVHTQD